MTDVSVYATTEEVKAILDDPWISTPALELVIPAAQEAVDAWCRRTFTITTETRALSYTSPSEVRLSKELISLSSVVSGRGEHANVFLASGPPYSVIYAGSGEPFTYENSPAGAIQVTGTWGYKAAVPARVKMATIQWSLYMYQELIQKGFQSVTQSALTATVAQSDKEPPATVQTLLRGLRRVRIESTSDRPFFNAATQF